MSRTFFIVLAVLALILSAAAQSSSSSSSSSSAAMQSSSSSVTSSSVSSGASSSSSVASAGTSSSRSSSSATSSPVSSSAVSSSAMSSSGLSSSSSSSTGGVVVIGNVSSSSSSSSTGGVVANSTSSSTSSSSSSSSSGAAMYNASSSSSSSSSSYNATSTGTYVPPGGGSGTYPAGSVSLALTIYFNNASAYLYPGNGSAAFRQDIAYNIGYEANKTLTNGNFTTYNILPFVVITSYNNVPLAPLSRRLLQANTPVYVTFVILSNITTLTGGQSGYTLSNVTAVVQQLQYAAQNGSLVPYFSGAVIPAQNIYGVFSSSSTGGNGYGPNGASKAASAGAALLFAAVATLALLL